MKPQDLVAQDVPTRSLKQLYNCHNKLGDEINEINVRVKKGF